MLVDTYLMHLVYPKCVKKFNKNLLLYIFMGIKETIFIIGFVIIIVLSVLTYYSLYNGLTTEESKYPVIFTKSVESEYNFNSLGAFGIAAILLFILSIVWVGIYILFSRIFQNKRVM